jgi:hypothetical protein
LPRVFRYGYLLASCGGKLEADCESCDFPELLVYRHGSGNSRIGDCSLLQDLPCLVKTW